MNSDPGFAWLSWMMDRPGSWAGVRLVGGWAGQAHVDGPHGDNASGIVICTPYEYRGTFRYVLDFLRRACRTSLL